MGVSIEGSIIQLAISCFFVISGAGVRFWLLRGTRTSAAKWAAEGFFLVYFSIILFNSTLIFWMYNKELRTKNKYGYDQVESRVVSEQYLRVVFVIGLFYTPQIWALKCAFLAMFYDLNTYLSARLRFMLHATGVFVGSTFFANILFYFLKCRPIATNWSLDPAKSCSVLLSVPGVIITSWSNIVSDLAILTIGISIINSLQIKKRERSALWCVACVGCVSIVATVVRFVFCYKAAGDGFAGFELVHEIFNWSSLEIFFAFIAFFLPCLRALNNRREARKETNKGYSWSKRSRTAGATGTSGSKTRHGNTGNGEITVLTSFDVHSAKNESEIELNQTMGIDSKGNEAVVSTRV